MAINFLVVRLLNNSLPFSSSFEERIRMKPVWVLLHGAIGAEDQLIPLRQQLEKKADVHLLTFSGHGSKSTEDVPFSIELFAQDVFDYLQTHSLTNVNLFGYSMGGYVAMYVAKHHPYLVDKIITLGTKFEWNEAVAAREVNMLDPDKIEQKVPKFASILANRHSQERWKTVLQRTQQLLTDLGKENTLQLSDYSTIHHSTTILWAENDTMVSRDEGQLVASHLPNGRFDVILHSEHPIEKVNLEQLLRYFV